VSEDVKPARSTSLGLAAACLGMLTLQVSVTRLFSLLVWYHFAFLAIALALLGFTAGGVLVHLHPQRYRDRAGELCLYAAGAIVLSLVVCAHLPFGSSVVAGWDQIALFCAVIATVLVPFVLAGIVVSATLSAHPKHASKLYFADLVGSGLGCIVSLFAMDTFGGGAGGMLTAAIAFVAASIAFTWGTPQRTRALIALPVGIALLLLARDPLKGPFYLPNAKLYPRVPKPMIVSRTCTSLACVDLFQNPLHFGLWGMSQKYKGPLPDQVGVVIDAWAITSIVKSERGEMQHPALEALPPAVVHHFNRAMRKPPQDVLVIGTGGGLDVRTSLHFKAKHVDGVDINPTIVNAVKGPWSAFAGDLYHRPDVAITIAEGRHFLRASEKRWDLVQISGVDTYAASQAGAFALSENYLYTVEAFREYVTHLTDDGTLALTRWLYDPPRQTLRLVAIADQALRDLGLGDGAPRIVVIAAPNPDAAIDYSVVLVRRKPFTPAELEALHKIADAMAYKIVFTPDGKSPKNAFSDYFAATDKQAFFDAYPFRVEPTTDDAPFFFEHNRWSKLLSSRDAIFGAASGPLVLLVTFAIVLLLGAGLSVVAVRKTVFPALDVAYFIGLGLGYIAIELAFVPRFVLFLGHPSHALSVVLFAMLVASGIGSSFSARIATDGKRVAIVAGAVALLALAYPILLPRVFDACLRFPFAARVAIAMLLIALPAFLMGIPFPAALSRRHPDTVARAWVLNGVASVVASVGTMVLAISSGFAVVLGFAAACYALVAIAALRGAIRENPLA
jgi:hypothetical protein